MALRQIKEAGARTDEKWDCLSQMLKTHELVNRGKKVAFEKAKNKWNKFLTDIKPHLHTRMAIGQWLRTSVQTQFGENSKTQKKRLRKSQFVDIGTIGPMQFFGDFRTSKSPYKFTEVNSVVATVHTEILKMDMPALLSVLDHESTMLFRLYDRYYKSDKEVQQLLTETVQWENYRQHIFEQHLMHTPGESLVLPSYNEYLTELREKRKFARARRKTKAEAAARAAAIARSATMLLSRASGTPAWNTSRPPHLPTPRTPRTPRTPHLPTPPRAPSPATPMGRMRSGSVVTQSSGGAHRATLKRLQQRSASVTSESQPD
eukprot:228660_1